MAATSDDNGGQGPAVNNFDLSEIQLSAEYDRDAGSEDGDKLTIETPARSFSLALMMIIACELGDKTFLIAALLAMRHSRVAVFSGAFGSLVVMSIISALFGHSVPYLMPRMYTDILASLLFFFFGIKMIREGLHMQGDELDTEIEEVEEAIVEHDLEGKSVRDMEEGVLNTEDDDIMEKRSRRNGYIRRMKDSPVSSDDDDLVAHNSRVRARKAFKSALDGIQNLANLVLSPIFVQVS